MKLKHNPILVFLGWLGRAFIKSLESFTDLLYLSGDVLMHFFNVAFGDAKLRWPRVVQEFDEIGVKSIGIILVMSFSIGLIIVFVLARQLQPFGIESSVPSFVSLVLTRELAPLLTGIVLAGKVGASITAKLGTQKVNEEVLALEIMAIDAIEYLVAPRVLAAIIMLPCLTIIADAVGLFGGFAVGVFGLGIDMDRYWVNTINSLEKRDILEGLFKSVNFGIIISMIGSYEGLAVEGGSEEVGHATMVSVMTSTILIIIADAVLTGLFYAAR